MIDNDFTFEEDIPAQTQVETTPTLTDDGSFSAVFLYQIILCICVVTILILINTFFTAEYTQIDAFLKEEFSQKQNIKEDFGKLTVAISDFLNQNSTTNEPNNQSPEQSLPSEENPSIKSPTEDEVLNYIDFLPTLYT